MRWPVRSRNRQQNGQDAVHLIAAEGGVHVPGDEVALVEEIGESRGDVAGVVRGPGRSELGQVRQAPDEFQAEQDVGLGLGEELEGGQKIRTAEGIEQGFGRRPRLGQLHGGPFPHRLQPLDLQVGPARSMAAMNSRPSAVALERACGLGKTGQPAQEACRFFDGDGLGAADSAAGLVTDCATGLAGATADARDRKAGGRQQGERPDKDAPAYI